MSALLGALARGRARAEALMTDTCRIERATGPRVTGPDGQSTQPVETVYEGKCRLQSRGDWSAERDIGEAGLVMLRTELQLPADVTFKVNDIVMITASPTQPANVGSTFRIRSEFVKTHGTMHKGILIDPAG
ncbi:DUF6093 family protein [Phytomonospora sp. NPDC050363]|uniref:DUF6093 family protein n=1 Tax=Phytomonospora sp. NPDC050363 TaxID=3155642 RepID=UPI0033C1BFFC